jgi:hypothetical protein
MPTPLPFTEFTLGEIRRATDRPDETPEQTAARGAVIRAMYDSYAPRDAMEDLLVSQIICLRFPLADAMRDLALATDAGESLARLQRTVETLTRALMSWVRLFDQRRAREAKQQAQAEKAQAAEAAAKPVVPARAEQHQPARPATAPVHGNDAATTPRPNGAAMQAARPGQQTLVRPALSAGRETPPNGRPPVAAGARGIT